MRGDANIGYTKCSSISPRDLYAVYLKSIFTVNTNVKTTFRYKPKISDILSKLIPEVMTDNKNAWNKI